MPTIPVRQHESRKKDQATRVRKKKAQTMEIALRGPTGPRTRRGKQRSCYNAVKHGIFAKVVLRGKVLKETKADYLNLLASFRESVQPVGGLEEFLVEKLAQIAWRKARLVRAEAAMVMKQTEFLRVKHETWQRDVAEGNTLHLLRQTVGSLKRENPYLLRKPLDVLGVVRTLVEYRGFEPGADERLLQTVYGESGQTDGLFLQYSICSAGAKKAAEKPTDDARSVEDHKQEFLRALDREIKELEQCGQEAAAQEYEELALEEESLAVPETKELDRLLRYEASLDRSFDRTLNQLERLQRMRLGHAVPPPVKVELSR